MAVFKHEVLTFFHLVDGVDLALDACHGVLCHILSEILQPRLYISLRVHNALVNPLHISIKLIFKFDKLLLELRDDELVLHGQCAVLATLPDGALLCGA